MKTKLFSLIAQAILAVTLVTALALPARAQMLQNITGTFTTTNVLAGVSDNVTFIHGAGTSANTNVIEITKGQGLGLLVSCSPAAVTNVITVRFQASQNGTLWAHATPHIMQFNLTAVSTNYIFHTNLPPTVLDNFRYFRLYSTTLANTNAVTNAITWSKTFAAN